MIDLSHTKAELLEEIEARDPVRYPLMDLTDPRVATADAHVQFRGPSKGTLFPFLEVALSERFATVPRLQLIRDLLFPLKHALGNAYKHGNGRDRSKMLSVELTLTRKGVLIAITDDGKGFDVDRIFGKFQKEEDYFDHHGSGFRSLHRAMSSVSYENKGRTILLCFKPSKHESEEVSYPASTERTTPQDSPGARAALQRAMDAEWVGTQLSSGLPEPENGGVHSLRCRAYRNREGNESWIRYVVQATTTSGHTSQARVLSARVYGDAAAASADFDAASRLHEALEEHRLKIPRPVAHINHDSRLVLYDYSPYLNLWEYLTYRGTFKALHHSAARIGEGLAALHRSGANFPTVESRAVRDRLTASVARAERNLEALPSGSDLVRRFRSAVHQFPKWDEPREILAPIHGAFGWDCVHYGVDNRFYLFRLEGCRQSHPGFDLGGFGADLRYFTLDGREQSEYQMCLDEFLSTYNAQAKDTVQKADLVLFIALAIVDRLQRHSGNTQRLLEALETMV